MQKQTCRVFRADERRMTQMALRNKKTALPEDDLFDIRNLTLKGIKRNIRPQKASFSRRSAR